jgi:hypothetical protein
MAQPSKIFLLSPATSHGAKARKLLEPGLKTPAAEQLRSAGGMPLGALFRHLSGLYFNSKLAYARAFARAPAALSGAGVYIITMTDGLLTPDTSVGAAELARFAAAEHGSDEGRLALRRSARALAEAAGARCQAIFLGSLASGKYTDALLPAFGPRLLFPRALLGLGQLDRGALLFRCVREGRELEYAPVAEIAGKRPG